MSLSSSRVIVVVMLPPRVANYSSRTRLKKSDDLRRKSILTRCLTCATSFAKSGAASMRVNGKWLLCDDGVIRPVVPGFVRAAGGQLVEVTFLLDAGADRTVFSADF